MAKFVNVTYNRFHEMWEVSLINKETGNELYSSRRRMLLHAMSDCLGFAKNPDEVDETDWAKKTIADMQKVLEED